MPAEPRANDIDHNGFNNTKANLRLCTPSQNNYNTRVRKTKRTSKYKGVSRHKKSKSYAARIRYVGKLYDLGLFADEVEAAKAYDKKARELFGEFAYLNFPEAPSS